MTNILTVLSQHQYSLSNGIQGPGIYVFREETTISFLPTPYYTYRNQLATKLLIIQQVHRQRSQVPELIQEVN